MTSRLLKEARQSIINNGFWALKDTDIGKRMDEIVTDRYRVKTEKGLDLCRVAVLEREITREVIKFFFPKAVLGYYKIYGQTQDHHCTLNGTTPDMRILEVQLWSSHSQCVFDTGSHQHDLKATAAPNGLLKIPPERLEELGITPTEVEMPDGGLVLVNARLGFKTIKGKVAKLGYMCEDEARYWLKMRVPATLRPKVEEMETDTISTNFEFIQA